jgi:hypothetical protein
MPVAYAASDPAAEPRPGPTRIPCSLAQLMKSATTRKYPGKPIWQMTSTSKSACLRTSAGIPPGYRPCSPRSTSWTNHDCSLSPSGTGKRGMRFAPSVNETSQRSAMTSVLSQASGSSRQTWRISSGDLR